MKIIVAGGRDYFMLPCDFEYLDHFRGRMTELVTGKCRGVDLWAEQWALLHKIPVKAFPADWATHGKAAGPLRNAQMAQYADGLIAFPGGAGTASMIALARKHGLSIWEPYKAP